MSKKNTVSHTFSTEQFRITSHWPFSLKLDYYMSERLQNLTRKHMIKKNSIDETHNYFMLQIEQKKYILKQLLYYYFAGRSVLSVVAALAVAARGGAVAAVHGGATAARGGCSRRGYDCSRRGYGCFL